MKYIPALLLLLSTNVAVLLPARLYASNFEKIHVTCEGEIVDGARLYNFSGSDYFSVKDVARIYKCGMRWHPVTGKVTLFVNNHRIDFFIKTTHISVNGSKKRLSERVRASGDSAYIPASYIFSSEFARLTETVTHWNPETNILSVEKKINVLSPRFYSYPERTQVVIETLEDLTYSWSRKNPGLAVVSIQRGKLNEETIGSEDGIIREIDSKNKSREAEVRIYLTEGAGQITRQTLSNPNRVVINIARTPLAVSKVPFEAPPSTSPVSEMSVSTPTETAPTPAPIQEVIVASPKQKKLIVLDPGHGGDDPGAIGQNGTREKALNLAIVGELEQLFDQDDNYEVIVTRTDDTFIPLVDRTIIANEHNAHLFVSVHCNASINKTYDGFEIYFLSENASDTEAQATAVLENSVVRLEKTPNKKKAKLQGLLWSLVVNEHINESSEIASLIGREVCRRTNIENRGVKQAGFYVLRGTQMPAVLVECAYLSNLGAEAKLNTKSYKRKIADGIYEGIKRYDEKKGI
jgi:N-acetylmuramoyl-L-alanine amidase